MTADKPATEVERKFLIDSGNLPDDLDRITERRMVLKQGYLAVAPDGSEARVRGTDDVSFELTVKSAGGLIRGESTVAITGPMFEALWPQTQGARIEKVRLRIPHESHTIELDLYGGALQGLVVAEVEFADETAATTFTAPGWFARDVTGDKAYKNKNLAVRGLPRDRG
ncbi:CYTH domain-containing protein [Mycobacterium sp. NPDC003449]